MQNDIYEKTTAEKIGDFIKRNIYNFVLILVSVVFIFKDMVVLEAGKKSIEQIISDGLISFFMGMSFNIILGKKGILSAQLTKEYQDTLWAYSQQIELTDDKCNLLDAFCEKKNEAKIRRFQTRILSRGRIRYEQFVIGDSEKSNLTREQKKYWKKASRIKIHLLSPDNLLSETDTSYEKGEKEETLNEYEKKKNFKDASTKILVALVFGYFSVSALNGDVSALLWGAVQISLWLVLAMLSYIQNYTYVKDVYRQKIIRKTNLLAEFNSTYKDYDYKSINERGE